MHPAHEPPLPPGSSDNSGVSVSDSGAVESACSEFVVAGSPVPATGDGKGDSFDPGVLAMDLRQEVALQVDCQSEPSLCGYSPSLKPWDALSVSSFAHASCAQTEHEPSLPGDCASRGQPSDGSGVCGFAGKHL